LKLLRKLIQSFRKKITDIFDDILKVRSMNTQTLQAKNSSIMLMITTFEEEFINLLNRYNDSDKKKIISYQKKILETLKNIFDKVINKLKEYNESFNQDDKQYNEKKEEYIDNINNKLNQLEQHTQTEILSNNKKIEESNANNLSALSVQSENIIYKLGKQEQQISNKVKSNLDKINQLSNKNAANVFTQDFDEAIRITLPDETDIENDFEQLYFSSKGEDYSTKFADIKVELQTDVEKLDKLFKNIYDVLFKLSGDTEEFEQSALSNIFKRKEFIDITNSDFLNGFQEKVVEKIKDSIKQLQLPNSSKSLMDFQSTLDELKATNIDFAYFKAKIQEITIDRLNKGQVAGVTKEYEDLLKESSVLITKLSDDFEGELTNLIQKVKTAKKKYHEEFTRRTDGLTAKLRRTSELFPENYDTWRSDALDSVGLGKDYNNVWVSDVNNVSSLEKIQEWLFDLKKINNSELQNLLDPRIDSNNKAIETLREKRNEAIEKEKKSTEKTIISGKESLNKIYESQKDKINAQLKDSNTRVVELESDILSIKLKVGDVQDVKNDINFKQSISSVSDEYVYQEQLWKGKNESLFDSSFPNSDSFLPFHNCS
jgi:hypothetical protein